MKTLSIIIIFLFSLNAFAGQPPEKRFEEGVRSRTMEYHEPVFKTVVIRDTVYLPEYEDSLKLARMLMSDAEALNRMRELKTLAGPISDPQPYDSWTWVHLLGGYVLADLTGSPWASIGLTLTWEFGDYWSSKGKLPDPPWDKRGASWRDAAVGIAGAGIWMLVK